MTEMEVYKLWADGSWCDIDEEREYMSDDFKTITGDTPIGEIIGWLGFEMTSTFILEIGGL